jgi:transposase
MCSHEMNADLQAALNIARRHLFNLEYPPKKAQTDRRELWGSWYRKKLATVWK